MNRYLPFIIGLQLAVTNGAFSNEVTNNLDYKGEARIVGGNEATSAQPWMVSLRDKSGHACGGALVAKEWILTAAHCITSEKAEDLKVAIGGMLIDGSDAKETIQVKEIPLSCPRHYPYASTNCPG